MTSRILALLALLSALVGPATALEIKSDARPGALPSLTAPGEIAINRADGRFFYRDEAGNRAGGLLPDLDASGNLKFRNGMTLGRAIGGKLIPQPDRVEIQGEGSTGDLSATSARPAFAGSKLRTLAERLKDSVSVLDFIGVDPTGATNSRSGLAAAMNILRLAGAGVSLRFPCGQYLISGGPLQVTGSDNTLTGNASCVTILNGNPAAPAIQVGDGSALAYGNVVEGFTFAGAPGVTAAAGNTGITFLKQGHGKFANLKTSRYPGQLYDGIVFDDAHQMMGNSIETQDNARHGYVCRDSSDIATLNVRTDANGGNGLDFTGCAAPYMINTTGFGNRGRGISFNTGGTVYKKNVNAFFDVLIVDTSGGDNFYAEDLSASTCIACWASTQLDPGTNLFAAGFHLSGERVFDNTFIGAKALLNNFAGILQDGASAPSRNVFIGANLGAQGDVGHPESDVGNGRGSAGGYGAYVGIGELRLTGGSVYANRVAPIATGGSGKVSASGVFGLNNGPVRGVAAGPSPFTYTSGSTEETVCVFDGGGGNITTGGVPLTTSASGCIPLDANRSIVITYTTTPGIAVIPR